MGRPVLRMPVAIVIASVVLGTSGITANAIAGSSNQVNICANKSTGAMRLLKSGSCKKTETLVRVGIRGPQGVQGPQGEAGQPGPVGPAGASAIVLDESGAVVQNVQDLDMYMTSDEGFGNYGAFSFHTLSDGLWWRVSQSGEVWGPVGSVHVPVDQIYYASQDCSGTAYAGDVAITAFLFDSTAQWVNELGTRRPGTRLKVGNDWFRFTNAAPTTITESLVYSVKYGINCFRRADLPETLLGDVPTGFPSTLYPIEPTTAPTQPVLDGPLRLALD